MGGLTALESTCNHFRRVRNLECVIEFSVSFFSGTAGSLSENFRLQPYVHFLEGMLHLEHRGTYILRNVHRTALQEHISGEADFFLSFLLPLNKIPIFC